MTRTSEQCLRRRLLYQSKSSLCEIVSNHLIPIMSPTRLIRPPSHISTLASPFIPYRHQFEEEATGLFKRTCALGLSSTILPFLVGDRIIDAFQRTNQVVGSMGGKVTYEPIVERADLHGFRFQTGRDCESLPPPGSCTLQLTKPPLFEILAFVQFTCSDSFKILIRDNALQEDFLLHPDMVNTHRRKHMWLFKKGIPPIESQWIPIDIIY